jgi:hypothetical protein
VRERITSRFLGIGRGPLGAAVRVGLQAPGLAVPGLLTPSKHQAAGARLDSLRVPDRLIGVIPRSL